MVVVSCGAQEILNLLPHEYVDPSRLHELTETSSSKVSPGVFTFMERVQSNTLMYRSLYSDSIVIDMEEAWGVM